MLTVLGVIIALFTHKKKGTQLVSDGDCLKCGSCVAACPKSALSF